MHGDGAGEASWSEEEFRRRFRHAFSVSSAGIRIHCLVGGEGPPLVLLHGFPQHCREWRLVMPALADAGYTVIAPDLRGFGRSDRPLDGFDVEAVSEDIRQLVPHDEAVSLVGHDVGGSVAYAWAAAYPDEVRRLVLIEVHPAGLEPPSSAIPMLSGKPMWHLFFGATPDVPEALLAGREKIFVAYLLRHGSYDPMTFSDEDIDAYARCLAEPGGVRGALAHIRAMPKSSARNRTLSQRPLAMPVLGIGAELSYGSKVADAAHRFATDVRGAVAEKCGHWIPEERPTWLAHELVTFFAGRSASVRPAKPSSGLSPADDASPH